MPKRISITLLFTVAFAIVALFAATEAVAFCTYCDPPTEFSGAGWHVDFLGYEKLTTCIPVDPETGTQLPSVSPCYKWRYKIYTYKRGKQTISGANYYAICLPDCCNDPYIYVDPVLSNPDNLHIFGVGEGESGGFAKYVENCYVVKGTPDSSMLLEIVTTTNIEASLPAVLKAKKVGVQSFEIVGPGCSGYGEYSAKVEADIRKIKSKYIKIDRAPGTGCGIALWESTDGENWTTVDPTDPPTTTDESGNTVPAVECTGKKGKSGCMRECIFTAAASPGWTWVNLGGTWYKVWIP